MEEKVVTRIQELAQELESLIKDRERRISELRGIDLKVKELTAAVIELKKLLD